MPTIYLGNEAYCYGSENTFRVHLYVYKFMRRCFIKFNLQDLQFKGPNSAIISHV